MIYQMYVQPYTCRTQAGTEAMLQRCKAAGIKAINFHSIYGGAYYNSAFYTRGLYIETGFDPLAYLIQRGAELGIKIFVIVRPGADVYQFNSTWDIAGKYGAPTSLHWLDFSIPAARQRVADIAADIFSKYAPTGITLDYIRYPNTGWNPATSMHASDITQTVDAVSKAIARRGKLQSYVIKSDWMNTLQDWPNWIRAGLIDTAMPMMAAWNDTVFGIGWHLVASWIDRYIRPENLPAGRVVPCLYFPDFHNDSTGATVKPIYANQIEIEDARQAGYTNLSFYDERNLDQDHINFLKEETTMPLVTDLTNATNAIEAKISVLTAEATALTSAASDLTAQVAALRQAITTLEVADALADELAEVL